MDPSELLRTFVCQYYRARSEAEVDRRMGWWHWTSTPGRSVSAREADRRFITLTVTDSARTALEALSPAEQEQIEAEAEERLQQEGGAAHEAAARRRGALADVTEEHLLRQELAALPEDVRHILSAGDRPPTTADLRQVARIWRKLVAMTPEQRADYLSKVNRETANWTELDASIDRYLEDESLRADEAVRTEAAAASLFGCEDLYKLWKDLKESENELSDEHVADLAATARKLAETRKRFEEALARHGFADEESFSAAVKAYLLQFRAAAVRLGLDVVARVEHLLHEERVKLRAPGQAEAMVAAIAATSARADYTAAAALMSRTRYDPVLGEYVQDDGLNRIEAAPLTARAERAVVEAAGHDLLVDPERMGRGTSREKLAGLDADGARTYLLGVADERQRDAAWVRAEFTADPERVFSLPGLVEATKRSEGAEGETIYAWIVDDHVAEVAAAHAFSEAAVAAIALLLAALVPVGGWIAAAALVSGAALSVYQAREAIEEYRRTSAEYQLGFIQDEPSLLWVVVAVAAAALEIGTTTATLLKASAKSLSLLRTPLHEFATAADAETAAVRYRALLAKIDEVEELAPELRAALKAQAEAEQGLRRVVGEFTGRLYGGFLVDPTGPMEAMYYAVKKGVATVTKLRREARMLELLGDVTKLSRAEQEAITAAFLKVRRIVRLGEKRGMDEAMVLQYVDRLAAGRSSAATFDEILADMKAWRPPTAEQLRAQEKLVGSSELLVRLHAERNDLLTKLRAGPKLPSGAPDTNRIDEIRRQLAELEDVVTTDRSGVPRVSREGLISRTQRALWEAERLAEAARVSPAARMRQVFNASVERAEVASGKVDQVGRLRGSPGSVEVDHVVSLERMTRLEGFELLTAAERNALAVRRDNLVLMDASANASKGERSWREWRQASYYYVDAADIARWQARDAELTESLQTWVRTRVQGRRPAGATGTRAGAGTPAPPAGTRVDVTPAAPPATRVRVDEPSGHVPVGEPEPWPAETAEVPPEEAPKARRTLGKPEK
ncbi:hypothetical protein [Streptomyces sp. CB03911]|uniref:hypothetical protein n=1 Tax=Streptomycetaceae TaxID=2062 RepID=UPI0018FEB797|nr:hypothetical protein [Streptomyces sp. CB03911]